MNSDAAIKAAIDDHGPITFAEFMELALYGPGGYYGSGSPISASGDYFTSPSAHPLFGALIAVQLREMWQLLGSPGEFTVIEEGAGNGTLAADITACASHLDADFETALQYLALDTAPPADRHFPVSPIASAPQGITGCVLSNELLDAMPVHRFEVRDGELQEIFVTHDGQRFTEVLMRPSSPEIENRLGPLLPSLPDGYRGEINLDLDAWALRQATTLKRGWVIAIDYGFNRQELYRPERSPGSLRTYYQHTLGQDPLRNAGQQDITAHVDFTALDEAMTTAGFTRAGITSQAEFLARLGIEAAFAHLSNAQISRPKRRANEAGMAALVDLEGMGRFVVAVYSRNVGDSNLSGFGPDTRPGPGTLPYLPLLDHQRHIYLTGQSQSGNQFEVESFDRLFSDEP